VTNPANKIVLITGAGGGFGRHMVRQFRDAGAKLLLTDLTDDALHDAAADAGDDLVAMLATDLATDAGCDAVIELCRAANRVPDILVNNAGVGFAGRIDHVPRENWEALMQLNLLAPMRLVNHFVPAMVERGSGHIVNISSLAGWVGSHGMSAYCASKFGLRGFGVALAADLEDTGVHVTNVYPCFARTPILDSPRYGYDEPMEVPPGLISEPEDVVAEMIAGIRRNRLHVFPDKHARRVHLLTRFVPWLVPMLNRRMRARAIATAQQGR
jgi:NAD(P)-dependent dehydrogenase (short-subunit alcohol dehydrogenase family)